MSLSPRRRSVAWLIVLLITVALASTFPIADADPARTVSRLDGQLMVALTHGAPDGASSVNVSLRTGSGLLPLDVAPSERPKLHTLAGRQVRVRGVRARDGFEAVSLEPTNDAAHPRLAVAPETMRVAVVLMRSPDSKAPGVTREAAKARFFGRSSGSVAQWFAEASGGQTEVTGRVFGYYDTRPPKNECRLSAWLKVAGAAAARDGYSPGRYRHLVVYTPRRRCSFASSSYVGSSGVYLNGGFRQTVAEHELGHNLGLWDAGAYRCSPPTPDCLVERGDPVDVMGNASGNRHFSAAHKHMLGWIPSSEVKTVSNGTKTIGLTASERPVVAGSTQLVYVPRDDGLRYAIDRRESFGHDRGLSGVWIRIVGRVGTTDTALPVAKALAPGQSFVDTANAITIKTLSDAGPTASVQVCAGPCATGGTPTVQPPPVPTTIGAAASRAIMWTRCKDVVALTDAQLDEWRARGIGGFVCMIQHLRGMGGAHEFSADPNAPLAGPHFDLQRQIRDSKIVARAAARGIKLWMGIYLSNYYNHATPLEEWFDDAEWSTVLSKLRDLAGAARMLGFSGLAFDEEQYNGGNWEWSYPGNTHTEAAVRAKVRARGAQMMATIVSAFPGVDLIDYWTYLPGSWNALVHQEVNHVVRPDPAFVQIDLWDGLTSVPGYGEIRFMDATFFKTAHLSGATWDAALAYNVNGVMAFLSRRLSNWSYAADRINISPFAWVDGDVQRAGAFSAPRDPAYVAAQLAAFRRWGMGGAFAIYSYLPLGNFDYAPYVAGMRAASIPGTIDDQAPGLRVDNVRRAGSGVVVSGIATDNMAVSHVRWRSGPADGAAPLTWSVTGGTWRTGYQWHMRWTATVPAASGQAITFTAHDSTGRTTDVGVTAP